MPATDDIEVARAWYEALPDQGVEGVVAKRANSPYWAGWIWSKVRHAETVDTAVIGYTGNPARSRALAVQLPDGRRALSQQLAAPLAAVAAAHLTAAAPGRPARTKTGDAYTTTAPG